MVTRFFPALQAACWFFTLISHLSIAIFSSVLLYTPLKPLFVFLTGFSASPSWSRRINGGWALLSKVSAGGNGQQVRKLGTLTMSKFMDLKTRKGALAQIPLPPPNISASSNAEQTTTRLLWGCVPRICCKIDRSRRSPTPVWNLRFGARSTAAQPLWAPRSSKELKSSFSISVICGVWNLQLITNF